MAEEFDPYAASKQSENKLQAIVIPDFVTKTKEYIKQHPTKLRELAPEMFQQLNEAIDTAEIELPLLGKVNIGEQFRKYQGDIFEKYPIARIFLDPDLQDAQEQGKDASGQAFISPDGQGQGKEPQIAAEEDLTVSEQKEVIEFMADLSEQGFDNAEIQKAVRREWGLDYHYLTIKRMLAAYYNRPESEKGNGKSVSTESLKVYQKLLDKNKELQKKASEFEEQMQEKKLTELIEQKVAELTPKPIPEVVKVERRGIIRRFLSWLW